MATVFQPVQRSTQLSGPVQQALAFTEAFKRHLASPPALREAACLRTQYPNLMGDIRSEDLLVGRHGQRPLCYVGTMWWAALHKVVDGHFAATKQGGYCYDFEYAASGEWNPQERAVLDDLTAFWQDHYTWVKATRGYDEEIWRMGGPRGQVSAGAIGFCLTANSDCLLQRGLTGLKSDVEGYLRESSEPSFYKGLLAAIEVVETVAKHYRDRAHVLAKEASEADTARLETIAATLDAILCRPPESFREAVQLFWLYTHLVSGKHPEAFRLDQALGDFLASDLDRGVLSEEEAIELVQSLWAMFNENGDDAVCRILVGGVGRRNPENANRFAMLAMEATRRHRRVTPQLTLRMYEGIDRRLVSKAFDCIAEGCCYPMLYNDDVVVPGIAKAMHVSPETAELYHPLGCGEYMIGWNGPSVLCVGWNVGKSLDAALHNGMSMKERVGPETGEAAAFETFDQLYAAFLKQIDFAAELSARAYRGAMSGVSRECPFLLASLLTGDCLSAGKGILEGSNYIGACVMGHGFTNAADSLAAIKSLVFDERRVSLSQIVQALDANFEGFDELRKALDGAPKFGNDLDAVDSILVRIWQDMSKAADEAGRRHGLDFYIVSSVNPGGYGMGEVCPATADGRRSGESFAIAHAPTAGKDTSGITALFRSIAKADPANGGATTNFKLSRDLFTNSRKNVEAMFDVYFALGGQEATVTVVNREDLEAALREPEKYAHLLVRLGGWCARFIDLSREIQEEIIRRTLY